MKKILFFLLFTVSIYGQTYQNPTYGTVTEKNNATDNTPAYFTTTQVDGVHKKTPAANVEKTANKSDSYTTSSSTTYASTKAVFDGLATKQNTLTNPITGTGTSGQVSFWNGTNSQTGDSGLFWNNTDKGLGIGTSSALAYALTIERNGSSNYLEFRGDSNQGFFATGKGILRFTPAKDIEFFSNFNIIAATIKASGNFLIGTDTDTGEKLQVNGSISATNYTGSATLTGTPTAPTATAGTNTTQIATTAFVQAANEGNVKTTGDQTIAGLKEFTDGININSTVNELFQINKSGVKYAHMIVDNVSNVKGFGLFGSYFALENTSLNLDPQLRIANSPENAFATIQAYSSTNPLTKHSLYLLASGEVYVRANNNDRVTLEGGSFYFKTGNLLVNTNIDNGVDKLQVNGTASFSSSVTATSFNGGATLTGTPTAPTATAGTNTTQIATTAFVQANARPYKVYTALLSQSGTSVPTATVLENTLGGTIVWTRNTTGQYFGTLSTAFVSDKTFCLTGGNTNNENIHSTTQRNNDNEIVVQSYSSGAKTDGVLNKTAIEIRVYN